MSEGHLGHTTDGCGNTDKNRPQGAEAIAHAFGASRRAVMRWKKAGAPIVRIGGKYQCQYAELWDWLRNNEERLY